MGRSREGMWDRWFGHIDWILWGAVTLITGAGLITMYAFGPENPFFEKQIVLVAIAQAMFFAASFIDYRFLRQSIPVALAFLITVALLLLVFVFGEVTKGAQSRFEFGSFAIQPSDPAKLVLIVLLAKYFARRHVEIADIKHILVSGAYAFVLFALVFLQPDFGSAIILGSIWFGLVLVAGISRKHLAMVLISAIVAGGGLWLFVLQDYQKERVMTFLHPLADIQGAGYNAYQSTIAVGSGQLLGKGIGYGTQSKLQFLPEYETDFIFAAFAEEWGFIGVVLLFLLYAVVFWRVISASMRGATNFETLFAAGVGLLLLAHFIVHIGMNIGVLPVTGTTVPFMSYGGSHLVTEFLALGMLMGMRRYERSVHKYAERKEFEGVGSVYL